jgi:hypothetical protein
VGYWQARQAGLPASTGGRAVRQQARAADKRGCGRQERQGGRHPLLTRASAAWQRILRAVNVEYVSHRVTRVFMTVVFLNQFEFTIRLLVC